MCKYTTKRRKNEIDTQKNLSNGLKNITLLKKETLFLVKIKFSLTLHDTKQNRSSFRFEMYNTKCIFNAILVAIVMSMTMGSCRHKPSIQEMGIKLDTIIIEQSAKLLPDSANSPECHISISLITIANKEYSNINDSLLRCGILSPEYLSLSNRSMPVRSAVDSFITRYIQDYRDFYSGIYNDELDSNNAILEFKLSTSIMEGTDSTLVYQAHQSNKQGEVSTEFNKYVNIDLRHKKLLTLDDIFVHGHENALNDAICRKLLKQTGNKDESQLHQSGFFSNIPIYATNNFKFEDKSITFVYVMGEIADRDKGEIQVEVNNSDIKTLFKR